MGDPSHGHGRLNPCQPSTPRGTQGAVAVISTTNEIRAVLGPSECFGELALITAGKRSASCTSLTFTDLAVLDGSSLRAVMHVSHMCS